MSSPAFAGTEHGVAGGCFSSQSFWKAGSARNRSQIGQEFQSAMAGEFGKRMAVASGPLSVAPLKFGEEIPKIQFLLLVRSDLLRT
jgi:hypothetical protein